jgi:hypothetical protein
MATGLAGVMLTRYEALGLAPVMAIAAMLNDGHPLPHGRSVRAFSRSLRERLAPWLRTLMVILLPTLYIFALWTLLQYVLIRDPIYWYKMQKAVGHISQGYEGYLPAHTLPAILSFTARFVLAIIPCFAVIAPLLIFRRRLSSALTGLGLLAGALVWPFIVVLGLIGHTSSATPRYFESALVFVAVSAMWLASDLKPKTLNARRAVSYGLIGLLAVSALGGTVQMDNPKRAMIELENHFYGPILGHKVQPTPPSMLNPDTGWRALTHDLDPQLARGSKVLVDMDSDNRGFLFTHYPDRFIVDADRDYLSTLSDPVGKFDYLILAMETKGSNRSPTGHRAASFKGILSNQSGGRWVKWKSYYPADVYHWVPAGPSGPAVPQIERSSATR